MRLDTLVKYRDSKEYAHLLGKIKIVHGKKWITIAWSDNVNLREHIEDLIFLREGRKD